MLTKKKNINLNPQNTIKILAFDHKLAYTTPDNQLKHIQSQSCYYFFGNLMYMFFIQRVAY